MNRGLNDIQNSRLKQEVDSLGFTLSLSLSAEYNNKHIYEPYEAIQCLSIRKNMYWLIKNPTKRNSFVLETEN